MQLCWKRDNACERHKQMVEAIDAEANNEDKRQRQIMEENDKVVTMFRLVCQMLGLRCDGDKH